MGETVEKANQVDSATTWSLGSQAVASMSIGYNSVRATRQDFLLCKLPSTMTNSYVSMAQPQLPGSYSIYF
jgi:hypothetical protein